MLQRCDLIEIIFDLKSVAGLKEAASNEKKIKIEKRKPTGKLNVELCFLIIKKIKSSLYSRNYAEVCNEFCGAHLRVISPAVITSLNYVAAVVNRWQHCVQFDRPEIWTSNLPLLN